MQVCKNEKDDDSATRRKEMELAEEEDFGNNLVQHSKSESIERFIEGQAFSLSYDLAPRSPFPPPLSRQ